LVESREVQLVRPPVPVRPGPVRLGGGAGDRGSLALAVAVHLVLAIRHVGALLSFLLMTGSRNRRDTLGTSAPVDDLGFVDLVARVVGGRQAGGVADRTVDVDHPVAGSADEVVVVVTDPVLGAGRRPGGLDAPEETLVGEGREDVVHRLP